ncbi:MAG: glycogen/starch/alpha-glucan phosphorylase [Sulfolobales archaeon]|nr:glycogen/starch/alpha-glucan phosphorylase [Sulfolobales archaeon]
MVIPVEPLDPLMGEEYNIISVTPDMALDIGHTYAGGLGVLEGDKFYAAATLGLRYITFSLMYSNGYVSYEFDADGNPIPKPQPQPEEFLKLLKPMDKFRIRLRSEDVEVEPLIYENGNAKAVFLRPTSPQWASQLIDRLYIESSLDEKFYKYTFFAKSVAEFIRRNIPIYNITYIDLQEAYTAFLPLILKIPGKYRLVIHTAGIWGHPSFPRNLIHSEYCYNLINPEVVLTDVGLAASSQAFAVSAKHLDILLKIFPHFGDKLSYVTNGINIERWMHPKLREIYESHKLTLDTLPEFKRKIRNELEGFLRNFKDVSIEGKILVMWGRRIVAYKRPWLIVRLIKELRDKRIVFILSGKAHPNDGWGLEVMKEFMKLHRERENVIYLPEYTVDIAKKLLSGVDLLLFTPFSGWEACGTSYMKAAVNAVPTISSRDGGILELVVHGVNGWLFGDDIREPINYVGPEADEINEREYQELKKTLLEAANLIISNPEAYYRISLSSMRSFIPRVSMIRVLREYYPQLIKLPTI